MAKDIEEFLRMAAARRRESQATPPAAATPAATPRPSEKKVSAKQRRPAPKPNLVSDDEIEVVAPRRESVAKHVESHIDTSRMAKHAEKLGEKVGRADDVLEARLQQTFDHQVGTLGRKDSRAGSSADPKHPTRAASSLIQSIVSPEGIRQAIIVNEILRRPEWE